MHTYPTMPSIFHCVIAFEVILFTFCNFYYDFRSEVTIMTLIKRFFVSYK